MSNVPAAIGNTREFTAEVVAMLTQKYSTGAAGGGGVMSGIATEHFRQ